MKTSTQTEAAEKPGPTEHQSYLLPHVSIFEEKDGYTLEAEMPGVSKDGLEVLLEGNELTILGHRQRPTYPGVLLFRESQDADYRRVFELDAAIDTSRIGARMNQGVLTLTLPNTEQVKPRRIAVDE